MKSLLLVFISIYCGSIYAIQSPEGSDRDRKYPHIENQVTNKIQQRELPTPNTPLPVRVVESPSETARTAANEEKADQYNRKNLHAYERAADAAERQILVSWVSAVFGILGTFLLLWNLSETRKVTKAADISANAARDTPPRQTSCRPDRTIPGGINEGRTWLDTDKDSRIAR